MIDFARFKGLVDATGLQPKTGTANAPFTAGGHPGFGVSCGLGRIRLLNRGERNAGRRPAIGDC